MLIVVTMGLKKRPYRYECSVNSDVFFHLFSILFLLWKVFNKKMKKVYGAGNWSYERKIIYGIMMGWGMNFIFKMSLCTWLFVCLSQILSWLSKNDIDILLIPDILDIFYFPRIQRKTNSPEAYKTESNNIFSEYLWHLYYPWHPTN